MGPTQVCPSQSVGYCIAEVPGATNYTWFWPGDWFYGWEGQGGPYISLFTGTSIYSTGTVGVSVSNACGPGGSPSTLSVYTIQCGSYSLAISPNPTSSKLKIEIMEEQTTARQVERIEITDGSGAVLKTFRGKGKIQELDIHDLPKGFCYVKVRVDGEVSTRRIFIE